MKNKNNKLNRRDFIKTSAGLSLAAVASQLGARAYAAGEEKIRAGLIGCGGRGTDAVDDCCNASRDVELVAMGDLFEDHIKKSGDKLAPKLGERFKVKKEMTFTGFDAYKKVCACDLDMVIITSPPHFHPIHLKGAIEAGKHVFMEKPGAVDPAGVRSVIESAALAEQKKLAVVVGSQRRHQKHYIEIMKRVADGAIGEIRSGQVYWCGGDMIGYWTWYEKGNMTNMQWQCRSWPWFTWLSGDHVVEQHVHNLDIMHWALGSHPVKAFGMGGRAVRKEGNIFDHFAAEFEFENGVRIESLCRQINGCSDRVSERFVGTKGVAYLDGSTGYIEGQNAYKYEGENPNPYVVEHFDLIKSIKEGKPLNEGKRIAESTLSGVMARMSAYTGRELSWDWAMNASKLNLAPDYNNADLLVEPVAVPGKTQLI